MFDPHLSLLRVYTAWIKQTLFAWPTHCRDFGKYQEHRAVLELHECGLQALTEKAMDAAEKIASAASYKLLDELDRILLLKFSLKHASLISGHAEAFLPEQLISRQVIGFLAWKLPRDPSYLSGLCNSLILYILTDEAEITLLREWRKRGIEMLQLALETQTLRPEQIQQNEKGTRLSSSPWSVLISDLTSWWWGNIDIRVKRERFWKMLEAGVISLMLLRYGADLDVMVQHSDQEPCTAFEAYLNLVFGVPHDTSHESLYLRVLGDFLAAGASRPSLAAPQPVRVPLSAYWKQLPQSCTVITVTIGY
ncbi:hypothetical protein B0H63DRAFT_528512 [Podospora didyma]|uniref:Uncharacterized protein n=1 Tax=Podospora didyma TaxID=330526 RepID=A0AAE0N2T1_9PEZI|nr:hypothetical protein B0H63DRAFT_528512 [Podospora didyma]